MASASLHARVASGTPGTCPAANLSYTRFFFIQPQRPQEELGLRMRALGNVIERGFFNGFELKGAPDAGPHETIQFLGNDAGPGSRYALQVASKYRPRLDDVEREVRKRTADIADVIVIDGAARAQTYTSAEVHAWAFGQAKERASGRYLPNAIVLPIRKTAEWWAMSSMERHQYFYPHHDRVSGKCAVGHALIGRDAAPLICRRVFHNPDGPGQPGQWDFVTYFECADEHLAMFDATLAAMRDTEKNPEWRYVEEGPLWKGRRVNRW